MDTSVRMKALDDFYHTVRVVDRDAINAKLDSSVLLTPRLALNKEPLEHIFSHVRHLMWIEYLGLKAFDKELMDGSWSIADGREMRLMSEEDMDHVGITSCVKKIIALVKKSTTGAATVS